ncbi:MULTISPECIES: TerD family protein [unclassified Streptomyces]|uniref:TerD family protein n=1 Tax=unclassified Streptomyces TaxID=2593676 RepID=UPI0036EA6497
MSTPNKDIQKVVVSLKWDPSPLGSPAHDLDIIAATYAAEAPYGSPVYLVHFDSRSPDGTIILNRDSRNGQGLGFDEVMTLELNRLSTAYTRVVVGVAIQQRDGHRTFAEIANTGVQVREGYTNLSEDDFSSVGAATAATVAEFIRNASGVWEFHRAVRGFDGDPGSFAETMGNRPTGA